ncbi:MAG: hypothetical protein AAF629_25930 [Chloroflexota bacterium]
MDIQRLVDELESIIGKSFRIPFSSNIILNEDELFDILDQMRISIPQEIKEARRTEAERERILAQARDEVERMNDLAKEKMMTAVDGHEVASAAKERSDQIIAEANQEAVHLRTEADQYVADHLSHLEEQLLKMLTTVQNGIRQIDEDKATVENTPAQKPSSPSEANQ